MRNKFALIIAIVLFNLIPNTAEADYISEEELSKFAAVLFEIHSTQDEDAYLRLSHPMCPDLPEWRIKASIEDKWIKKDTNRISFKKPSDIFDFDVLNFKVKPEAVIEFQVMTQGTDQQIELVTVYPVAKYNQEIKFIEYPCFEPK